MVGAAILIATILAYVLISQSIKRIYTSADAHLQTEADAFLSLSSEHFLGAVAALRSARGFFYSSEVVTRSEFYNYVEVSKFLNEYSGFQTFSYAPLVLGKDKDAFLKKISTDTSIRPDGYPAYSIQPEGMRETYLPIQYIYPEEEVDFLLGLDSLGDAIRTENSYRARDVGDISVSSLLNLGEGGDGVLVVIPLYQNKDIPETVEERQHFFSGTLTTVIDIDTFFSHILPQTMIGNKNITISIAGRGGDVGSIQVAEKSNNIFSKLYAKREVTEELSLTEQTNYDFTFDAEVNELLSFDELFEPFLLAIIFFLAAVFMSIVILFSQKARTIEDVKKRYAFISTLSHQLRTPLTNLRWQIESRIVPKGEEESQRIMMQGVLILNSIIDRMLLYIGMTAKKEDTPTETLLSFDVLYKKILNALSKSQDVARVVRIGKKTIPNKLLVDEQKIVSAILYVIENALIYSPKDKAVNVEAVLGKTTLSILVTDKGYGIPAKEQEKVFSEFFRASNASLGINMGSGVSLAIAKRIIEEHGGSIQFSSKENEGSIFEITLPLRSAG